MRARSRSGLLFAGLLSLIVSSCHGPAEKQRDEIKTVDVPPLLTFDVEQDPQEAQRVPELAGVLPGDFPSDLPLYAPSSLIDFGSTEGGPRYVVLLSPHTRPRVAGELEKLLRESGWVVEPGPSSSQWLRKDGYRVRLVFEDSSPGARYRIEY